MKLSRLPSSARWFFALAAFIICLISTFAVASGQAAGPAAPISLDISSLTGFLDSLPPDEKDEQLRDWAAYGLRNSLLPAKTGELPVRHPALESGRNGDISRGRVIVVSSRNWAVIAPPELLRDKPRIGGLIDRKYAQSGRLPESVSLFSYRYDPASALVTVEPAETVELKRLFTPEYGYRSQTVTDLAGLTEFMNHIDDLVSLSWRSGRLTLAGRKYSAGKKRALSVEDVAALYQAYNPPTLDRAALEKQIQQSFEALVQSDAGLRKALRQGKIKKSQVLARLRRQLSPPQNGQVGFSLDPAYDFAALASDVRVLSNLPSGRKRGLQSEVQSVATQLETRHDLRPLLAMQLRYQNSTNPAERNIAGFLKGFQRDRAFQAARYDGNLQGTTVGMTLFYTDLLAKLWALDYQGVAPKGKVTGFRTMGEIAVPRLYWDDFLRLSQTRLWFGLRSEGFDVFGDKLLFQPAVTRVYAASSDPMHPGKESKPNFQSDAFLGWWDRHYEAVAAAEPYYYKLDQIQKWSCALMILKEKKSRQLDFLGTYPVRRNLDFESWSRTEPVMAGLNLEFMDRVKLGRRTECLPLLASASYPLMRQQFVLSGGVSLASRGDILSKLRRHAKVKATADDLSDGDEATEVAPPAAHGKAKGPAGRKHSLSAPPTLAHEDKAREKVAEVTESPAAARKGGKGSAGKRGSWQGAAGDVKGSSQRAAGDEEGSTKRRNSKAVTAPAAPVTVKLSWEKGPSVAVHDLVNALAAKQQREGRRSDHIFDGLAEVRNVARVKEGAYLVKTAGGKESWIYVEVNPGRTDGYPAKASAALPDADIFCAKMVTDTYARTLTAGRAER